MIKKSEFEGEEGLFEWVAPKDSYENEYHVPVVVKNPDVLYAFHLGLQAGTMMFNARMYNYSASTMLSSGRFMDLLPNGNRLSKMTEDETYDYIFDKITNENDKVKESRKKETCLSETYLIPVECTCGNFYGFNKFEELPAENLICDICSKVVIEYTGIEDNDMIYIGVDLDYIDSVTEEVIVIIESEKDL